MGQRERDKIWEDRAERAADAWTHHPVRQVFKWTLGIIATVMVLTLIGNIFGITSIFWGAQKAKLTIKPRVTQRVFTPDNAIAQIAFFHDQCNGVNAAAQIINNNEQTYLADLQAAKNSADPIRQQQAQDALSEDATNITGAKNVLVSRAADYNSRSQQSTANVFKGHGLPRSIDVPTSDSALATFHVDCGPGR